MKLLFIMTRPGTDSPSPVRVAWHGDLPVPGQPGQALRASRADRWAAPGTQWSREPGAHRGTAAAASPAEPPSQAEPEPGL
eukprot:1316978-Rhodomonas_salina.1